MFLHLSITCAAGQLTNDVIAGTLVEQPLPRSLLKSSIPTRHVSGNGPDGLRNSPESPDGRVQASAISRS
jgi:hypothetical protein